MTETRVPDLIETAVPEPPVSYEEFLDWADEDVRAEWVDGKIHVMSPASDRHQDLARFLTSILSVAVEADPDDAIVRPAPFQMKLDRGREPDVLVVKEKHRDRVKDTYLEGPADLVVEVISSESGTRDRGEKFYEYEEAGIPEYWLVDPEREELTVYRRKEGRGPETTSSDASGRYRTAFEGHEGRAESAVLDGFWIEAEWLWQEELPAILTVLDRWELI